MIYPDLFPIDALSGSVESTLRFMLIHIQLKTTQDLCWFSLNRPIIYPDLFPVDAFPSLVKSILRFLLIHYPVKDHFRPLLVQF